MPLIGSQVRKSMQHVLSVPGSNGIGNMKGSKCVKRLQGVLFLV